MKALKKTIIDDLLEKINRSPFVLVIDYTKMTVPQFAALRGRLAETQAELHVAKNTYVRRAGKEAALPEGLNVGLVGQTAVVTGVSDICAAAKALQEFTKATGRGEVRSGVLDGKLLTTEEVSALAALPPMDVLRAMLLGTLNAPASTLVRLLNEPASALARVLKAKSEKE